jgi:hypothetical protein
MWKCGKSLAEIRKPNKWSRILLGSYSTVFTATHDYDTTVFNLRGHSAWLNFLD